jgi:O-antigen ligase
MATTTTHRGHVGAGSAQRLAIDHPLPQLLFYLIVASIPFFQWRQLPGPAFMKVDWLLMAALLVMIGVYLMTLKRPPVRLQSNIWGPLGLFLVANIVSVAFSPYPEQATGGLIALLQSGVFIVVATLMVNDRGVETVLPWVLGLSVGLNATLSILGYFFGLELFTHEGGRAFGATIGANNMALMCVFTLPLMIHCMIYASTASRCWLGALLAVILIFGVFSTVSRGGFVNLLVVLVLVAVQYRKHFHPRYLGLLVAGFALAATLVVAVVPTAFFERQVSLVTEGTQDKSISRRSYYIRVGLEAFGERPLMGWGPNAFQEIWVESRAARRFNMEKRPAHNTYMEVAVGSGLVGLAVFGFLMVRTYRNYAEAQRLFARQERDREAHLMGAYKVGVVIVLVYFLFKSGLEHKYFLLALPLSYAVLAYARRQTGTVLSAAGVGR